MKHTRNLSMMTDLYQLTMANGYFLSGTHRAEAVFDMFFRHKGQLNLGVFAGLEQAVDYIKNLKFDSEDIAYLRSLNKFAPGFLDYLADFRFTGTVYSAEEGEIVFPYEPTMIVKAPLIEAQIIETALLNIINHQTLIATKASKVVYAAGDKAVVEFGLRRAQGPDAGIYGSRASIIGGCGGTSNVLAGQMFGIDIKGTHSHSWVMSFGSEEEAFERFSEIYPDSCLLLVDTYDTLNSGIPAAVKVFKKLKAKGHKPLGIRLDSGDLAYLSKRARIMLDEAGFKDAVIFASGDIDEHIISSLNAQGAMIDVYGVGTKLITSENTPSLGGVYKLSSIQLKGKHTPRMKVSSREKMTNPGHKRVYRLYGEDGMASADLIALDGEDLSDPLTLEHETDSWKKFTLKNYTVRELLIPVFKDGKCVYKPRKIQDSAKKAKEELGRFWEEYKRLLNPQIYKVNVSPQLLSLKKDMLREIKP